jgi:hypothetical protein
MRQELPQKQLMSPRFQDKIRLYSRCDCFPFLAYELLLRKLIDLKGEEHANRIE